LIGFLPCGSIFIGPGSYDIAKAFAVVMDADDTYVRVPWSQADKVRAFVELIAEKEFN
jgi:hypothetical protein